MSVAPKIVRQIEQAPVRIPAFYLKPADRKWTGIMVADNVTARATRKLAEQDVDAVYDSRVK
jgi:hypothetical protein